MLIIISTSSSVNSTDITVSLRLGHATALTPHCGVIHYRGAASLPHREGKKKFVHSRFVGSNRHRMALSGYPRISVIL